MRDDSKKITEEQIRAGSGNLNPFDDVVLLERSDGVVPPEPTLMDKFNTFLNPFGTGKEK